MGEALITRRGGGGGGELPTVVYTDLYYRSITNLKIEPGVYLLEIFTINHPRTNNYTRFIIDEVMFRFKTDGSSVEDLGYTFVNMSQQSEYDEYISSAFDSSNWYSDTLTVTNGLLNFTCGSRYEDYGTDRQWIRLIKVG